MYALIGSHAKSLLWTVSAFVILKACSLGGAHEWLSDLEMRSMSLHLSGYCFRQNTPRCLKLFQGEKAERMRESRRMQAIRATTKKVSDAVMSQKSD